MNKLALGVTLATLMISAPVLAQTTNSTDSSTSPSATTPKDTGSGGTSKPGMAAKPGSESGAASSRSGSSGQDQDSPEAGTVKQHDQSGVKGAAGNKSGTSTRAPGEHDQKGTKSGTKPDAD